MCRNSSPADKICDQCKRHGLECTYLAHARGRKLGSRNKKGSTSSDMIGPSSSTLRSSVDPTIYRSESSGIDVPEKRSEQHHFSRRPSAPVGWGAAHNAWDSNTDTANIATPSPAFPFLAANSIPAKASPQSPNRDLAEQSPLALLARTAESRSKGDACARFAKSA